LTDEGRNKILEHEEKLTDLLREQKMKNIEEKETLLDIGEKYLDLKVLSLAQSYLTKFIEKYENSLASRKEKLQSAKAHRLLGITLREMGKNKDAIEQFRPNKIKFDYLNFWILLPHTG